MKSTILHVDFSYRLDDSLCIYDVGGWLTLDGNAHQECDNRIQHLLCL